jgi:hypothetical protein
MFNPTEQMRRIAMQLRQAYEKHGFDTSSKAFAMEMFLQYGPASEGIVDFFNNKFDLPMGTVLRLCRSIGLPLSHIFSDDHREHIQIYDYLGSNPCHIFLPAGFAWDRSLLHENLFYLLATPNPCQGINENDLIVMTRRTSKPVIGEIFAIETESELLLRRCGEINKKSSKVRFMRLTTPSIDDLTFPIGKDTSKRANDGIAALTGRMLWTIHG